jgi:hypothetical protein
MARKTSKAQPASAPAEALDANLARIGAMNIDQLRACWRKTFASDPPAAFSKDLLARAICYRLQEQQLGGLPAAVSRLLRSLGKPGVEPPRQVKIGSVIIREHQSLVHEVLVVPGGFCWQGKTYDNLSKIATRITGVSWNGPRFFGLRSKQASVSSEATVLPAAQNAAPRSGGRRSSVQAGAGMERSR